MAASRNRGRSPADRALRARQVLRTAHALATEGGYEAVQMREVARRADVVLTTLYRYYPSKDDLIRAVTDGEMAALRARVVAAPPRNATPQDRAAAVVIRVFRTFEADRGFAHAAMNCYITPRPWNAPPHDGAAGRSQTFGDIIALAAWGAAHTVTDDQRLALNLLESILGSCVISWLNGELTPEQAEDSIRYSASHLIDDAPAPRRRRARPAQAP